MVEKSIVVRPYQQGGEYEIFNLFRLSYGGSELPEDYWRWRFQNNPGGTGLIDLAWNGDVLAAHYAVTSVAMRIAGQDGISGLSGTTMTHPDYRGKGLFPILARSTYERMAEIGMKMVFGFPNSMSHRGFVKTLKWIDIYEIPMFRLSSIPQRQRLHIPSQVCELFDVDYRFDIFWEKVCDEYDIITRRDKAYLKWRYISNPVTNYRLIAYVEGNEIQGYAVFKKYNNQYQVVDLLIDKKSVQVGEALLHFISCEALKNDATSISLWLNVAHPFHHALEKMGFGPENPITYFGGLFFQQKLDISLYDFRRWYITMGDSDVF